MTYEYELETFCVDTDSVSRIMSGDDLELIEFVDGSIAWADGFSFEPAILGFEQVFPVERIPDNPAFLRRVADYVAAKDEFSAYLKRIPPLEVLCRVGADEPDLHVPSTNTVDTDPHDEILLHLYVDDGGKHVD